MREYQHTAHQVWRLVVLSLSHHVRGVVPELCLHPLPVTIANSSCFLQHPTACYNDIMPSVTLLLHNIRSTYNVGSIFRTAEGFGVERIVLTGYTPYPQHISDQRLPHLAAKITKQIHKTAL